MVTLFFILSVLLFILSFGALVYTFIGYPLFLRFKTAGQEAPPVIEIADSDLPKVSFIIIARNEENSIKEKLENTLQLDYPEEKLEIIVASDASEDSTDEIVQGFSDKGVKLVRPKKRLGKTLTGNFAVRQSTGEILVFSDATSIYEQSAIKYLIKALYRPFVGVVSGKVVYEYPDSSVAKGFKSYQKIVIDQRLMESNYGSVTSVSGAIHAIRRSDYHPIERDQASDLILPFAAACEGKRAIYEPRAICLEKARKDIHEEYNGRLRASILAAAFMQHLFKNLSKIQLPEYLVSIISGKVLRWLAPYIYLLLMLSTLFMAIYYSFFWWLLLLEIIGILALIIPVILELKGKHIKKLSPIVFISITLWAFFVGLYQYFVEGKRIYSWEPQRN